MKAEHRKELETNILADRLGRWMQGIKSGASSRGLVIWIFIVLAVGIGISWMLLKSSSNTSELWRSIDTATGNADIAELNQLADANKGTIPGRVARFQVARLLLHDGMQVLGASAKRQEGADKLEQARDLYEKLAQETSDAPLLQQEALMGAAKAEETLTGIPKKDDPKESRGTLERAQQLYDQLAAAKPESFHTRAAEERAKVLKEKGEQIQQFYAELQNSFPSRSKD